jgi:hypothetical protein
VRGGTRYHPVPSARTHPLPRGRGHKYCYCSYYTNFPEIPGRSRSLPLTRRHWSGWIRCTVQLLKSQSGRACGGSYFRSNDFLFIRPRKPRETTLQGPGNLKIQKKLGIKKGLLLDLLAVGADTAHWTRTIIEVFLCLLRHLATIFQ